MPKEESKISVTNSDKENILAIAYSALKSLSWTVQYAVEDKIMANTEQNWKDEGESILLTATDGELSISSELHSSAIYDLFKKNKKNIQKFQEAFEIAKNAVSPDEIDRNEAAIDSVRVTTSKAIEEEIKQGQEIEQVMNLGKSNLYITYGIMGMNVAVFLLMAAYGVSIMSPTGIDIIKWGGNYEPLTLTGDWWRLFTCVFVHIGVIHIAMNMYALYMVGIYLEPMLGKLRYIAAYIATGLISSIVSLWWHKDPTVSAGASGAIFGMYGVFLALLSTSLIPKAVRNSLLQSIGVFVLYNIIYGMRSGVDNAAHVGGLLSGLVIGYIYYVSLKAKQGIKTSASLSMVMVLASVFVCYYYIENKKNTVPLETKEAALREVNDSKYKDVKLFNEKMGIAFKMQDRALAPYNDSISTTESFAEKLANVSLVEWKKFQEEAASMQLLDVSVEMKKRAALLAEYGELRLRETELRIRMSVESNANYIEQVEEIVRKINAVTAKLNSSTL